MCRHPLTQTLQEAPTAPLCPSVQRAFHKHRARAMLGMDSRNSEEVLAASSTNEDASRQPNPPLHSHFGGPWGYVGISKASGHHPGAAVLSVLAASTLGWSTPRSNSHVTRLLGREHVPTDRIVYAIPFRATAQGKPVQLVPGGHQVHIPRPHREPHGVSLAGARTATAGPSAKT